MKKLLTILDFKFHNENYISLLALIFSIIFIKIFNLVEILENTLLENSQVIILLIGFIACFFAKKNKTLFNFIAFVLFLMLARELSYGRAIFCQYPDNPHEFYKWSHYQYGYLAHIFVGLYIVVGILYALINKIWIDIKNIFKSIKFPIWTFFGCVFCTFLQLFSEKYWHNTIIEETSELILYSFILAFVLIYLKQNNKN